MSWDDDGADLADAETLGYSADDLLEGRGIDVDELEDGGPAEADEPTGEPFPEDDEAWLSSALPLLGARTEAARLSGR